MNLVVAVDTSWGIGKDNDLLYHIPEDMRFFRELTTSNYVICGRKTLVSFPDSKPLPNRTHFVLTSGDMDAGENLVVVHNIEELEKAVASLEEDRVFVIGGETVYRQLYKKCKKAYVTKIFCNEKEADVFFPNLDLDPDFKLVEEGDIQVSKNGKRFVFLTYENIAL